MIFAHTGLRIISLFFNVFIFFHYRMSLSLWKENPERQMTLHLLILLTIANTYRYSILLAPFDVQHTDTTKPTTWITVRHKCTDCFFTDYCTTEHFYSLYRLFFTIKIHTVCTFRCTVTSGDVNIVVNFNEDYLTLVTDFCSTKHNISHHCLVHRMSWQYLTWGFNIIWF